MNPEHECALGYEPLDQAPGDLCLQSRREVGEDQVAAKNQIEAGFRKRMADVLNLDENHLLEVNQSFGDRRLTVYMILGNININMDR